MRAGSLLLAVLAGCGAREPSVLWVGDRDGQALRSFDADDGAPLSSTALDSSPTGVAFDDAGAIYTSDFDRDMVSLHRMRDGFCREVALDDPGALLEPVQVAFSEGQLLILGKGSRNLLVADRDGRLIRELGDHNIFAAHDLAPVA